MKPIITFVLLLALAFVSVGVTPEPAEAAGRKQQCLTADGAIGSASLLYVKYVDMTCTGTVPCYWAARKGTDTTGTIHRLFSMSPTASTYSWDLTRLETNGLTFGTGLYADKLTGTTQLCTDHWQ